MLVNKMIKKFKSFFLKEKISGYYYLLGIAIVIIVLGFALFSAIKKEGVILGATLAATLFAGGEARRARLEIGRTNRLSYLPGIILYFKEDKTLWLKNIGRGIALNPE